MSFETLARIWVVVAVLGGSAFVRHGLVAFILGVTYLSGAYLVSRDRHARRVPSRSPLPREP